MESIAWGVLAIVIGLILLAFRRGFARYAIEQQNAVWGTNYGPGWVRFSEAIAVVVGLGFVLLGAGLATGLLQSTGSR
jgi:hypothetical protein